MTSPLISVIIPAFNAEATLGMQLEALTVQVGAPEHEILVVNNGSTDGTARLVGQASASNPRIRLVTAKEKQGASYARNVGAAHARGKYLMFCDADDVVSAHWLAHGLRSFETTPLWSGSILLLTDEQFATTSIREVRERFAPGVPFTAPVDEQHSPFPVLAGGNFGITRELYLELGGFDQSFPSNGEDNDFAFRAQRAGHPVFLARAVSIGYRGKWSPQTIRRLARRSSRSHALLVTRYGVRAQSPYPHTLPELAKLLVFPLLAAAKIKRATRQEYLERWARWAGFAEGRARYAIPAFRPTPQLNEGLTR